MLIELAVAAAVLLGTSSDVEFGRSQEQRWTVCYVTAIRGDQTAMIKTGMLPEGNYFAGKAARYRTWMEAPARGLGITRVTASACIAPTSSTEDLRSALQVVEDRFLRQNSGAVALQPGDTEFRQLEAAIP